MKDIAKKSENRAEITRFLEDIVHEMIEEANQEWIQAQGDELDENEQPPLPLIRLRVEYTAPEGGSFECENPQRFSARFQKKAANTQDIVQFHRRKRVNGDRLKPMTGAEVPEEAAMAASLGLDSAKVEKLVRDYLDHQSLTMFPQNSFSDAVTQFVDKDDRHAMDNFVDESLDQQIEQLKKMEGYVYGDDLQDALMQQKSFLEELFTERGVEGGRRTKRKPPPTDWDSDLVSELLTFYEWIFGFFEALICQKRD